MQMGNKVITNKTSQLLYLVSKVKIWQVLLASRTSRPVAEIFFVSLVGVMTEVGQFGTDLLAERTIQEAILLHFSLLD